MIPPTTAPVAALLTLQYSGMPLAAACCGVIGPAQPHSRATPATADMEPIPKSAFISRISPFSRFDMDHASRHTPSAPLQRRADTVVAVLPVRSESIRVKLSQTRFVAGSA